jgi:hypothetical protein
MARIGLFRLFREHVKSRPLAQQRSSRRSVPMPEDFGAYRPNHVAMGRASRETFDMARRCHPSRLLEDMKASKCCLARIFTNSKNLVVRLEKLQWTALPKNAPELQGNEIKGTRGVEGLQWKLHKLYQFEQSVQAQRQGRKESLFLRVCREEGCREEQ